MSDTTNSSLSDIIGGELPYLRRYARALTGNQSRGDRFAAATLEAILAQPDVYDRDLAPKVALFKVFHSIWSSVEIDAVGDDEPLDTLEATAQKRLARLTPNTREAILLKTVEGLNPGDIATVMNVDEREASALLSTALAEMQDELKSRVMIIEDEPIIALDIKGIVTDTGHDVVGIARTRSEAVKLAKDTAPDLLLADVQLADGSSGIDAAHDILEFAPDLPIVFITAYPERLLTGDRPEPAFLITKPFSEEQVRVAVSQSLFFATSAVLS